MIRKVEMYCVVINLTKSRETALKGGSVHPYIRIYIFVMLISREKMNLVDGSSPNCVFIFIHAEYFTSTMSSLVNLTQIGQYSQ